MFAGWNVAGFSVLVSCVPGTVRDSDAFAFCVCLYGGRCLPTWSSIWINDRSQLCPWFQVYPEQQTLHLGKARLFQNRYFPERAGTEKPLSDDEAREFRAVMDGWRSPCRVREEERAALGVCPCGTGGAGTGTAGTRVRCRGRRGRAG